MKKIILTIVLILILVLTISFFIIFNQKEKGVIGSWGAQFGELEYIYTFNKDKTGSYSYGDSSMDFTYEDNGTELSISYTGNTVPSVFKYRIEENKLIIKDSFNSDVEYIKK